MNAAPPSEDEHESLKESEGDNDFFDNLKQGVDFEDPPPPPKRKYVEGMVV